MGRFDFIDRLKLRLKPVNKYTGPQYWPGETALPTSPAMPVWWEGLQGGHLSAQEGRT